MNTQSCQAAAPVAEGVKKEVLDKLFGVLKSWSDDMTAFRYESFARRLVAAEYGRPDAVEWAMNWHNNILAEERQNELDRQRAIDLREMELQVARARFRAGKCGNPHYQAFLDTLEHPELIENNAPYFAWISEITGRYENTPGLADMSKEDKGELLRRMIQEKRNANLADRLK